MTEPLRHLVDFADTLRSAGIAVSPDRTLWAAEALGCADEVGDGAPYWPLRLAFCLRREDVTIFDAVYDGWMTGDPADSEAFRAVAAAAARGPNASTAPRVSSEGHGGAGDDGDLGTRDFAELDEAERARINDWVSKLALAPPLRRVMRRRRARSGAVDVGRTVRLMLGSQGEIAAVRYRRRVRRPRGVLLLVDISGSMRPYSELYLRFAYAVVAARPHSTEVVAIGTEWKALTANLRARDANEALRNVAAVETGWDRGTTLGEALRGFLRQWGGRATVRSAMVVIFSDGFEFDDQSLLRRQVYRLSQLADTLIWVDPLRLTPQQTASDPDLAAAQSYAAARLPGHNFETLLTLAKAMQNV